MHGQITILNIGLDRDLLSRDTLSESQLRQSIYANGLPARIIHLVKAPHDAPGVPFTLAGGEITVYPLRVRGSLGYLLKAFYRGLRLVSSQHIDVIQAQEPFVSGLAGLLVHWWTGIPLVVGAFSDQIDNPDWLRERWVHRVANRIGKFTYRRAAAIRADSRTVAERLAGMGYRQARFVAFLITHSERLMKPAEEAREVREHLLAGRSGPLVLTVSRLEAEKNIPLLLEAFRQAQQQIPGLTLAIVGDGSLRRELETQSALLPAGSVRFLGRVANDQLPGYYQAADLFVLASNYESSARVLSEALLAATPVLVTDTAGAREVVEDGVSGGIVPVGNCSAFATRLIQLCDEPDRLRTMGRRGQAHAQNFVSQEAVLNGLRRLYAEVLEAHEPAAV